MGYRLAQASFSKGEIAEDLYGRFDVDAYQTAVRKGRNVYVLKYGGLDKRPGLRYVAEVLDASQPVRLVPFQFSIEQAYALEMGQGYMRVAALGGLVLHEELQISGISNAAQATVTAAYHGYSVGQQVFLSGIDGPLGEELNYRFFTVTQILDAHNFQIDANTSAMAAFTSASGGIARTEAPDPDPADPAVPDPVDPPVPPSTGAGGGNRCVAVNTPILMANGSEIMAGSIQVGDMVRTQHEHSMEWGSFPVVAVEVAEEDVFSAVINGRGLVATGNHRVWIDGWVHMRDIGEAAGRALIAKIEVADAHTYVSNGILSHNIKMYDPEFE